MAVNGEEAAPELLDVFATREFYATIVRPRSDLIPSRPRSEEAMLARSPAIVATFVAIAPATAQLRVAVLDKQHLPPGTGHAISAVAVDIDGDGDSDLFVTSNSPPTSYVHVNTGSGSYADETVARLALPSTYEGPSVAGDIDSDGDPDILTAGRDSPTIRVLVNDGSGVFDDQSALRVPAGRLRIVDLVLIDVDVDGDLDLYVATRFGRDRLLLNDGNGAFADVTSSHVPSGATEARCARAADVDGDGLHDLVQADDAGVRWMSAGPGGTLSVGGTVLSQQLVRAVDLGDLDRDGDLDMIVASLPRLLAFHNDGRGAFVEVTGRVIPSTAAPGPALALRDLDGDGDVDLLSTGKGGQVFLNDGRGRLQLGPSPRNAMSAPPLVMVDADADGDPDALSNAGPLGALTLWLNSGRGVLDDAVRSALPVTGVSTQAVAAADIDGDQDLDLVLGTPASGWIGAPAGLILENNGLGWFSCRSETAMSADTHAIAAADLDGDGDVDLLLGNDGRNLYLANEGSGSFVDVSNARLPWDGDDTRSLALVDVDNDGDLDLLTGNRGTPARLYVSYGSGRFFDTTVTHMPGSRLQTMDIAVGDVDGDGDPDLVLGNDGQQDTLYLNDGFGRFSDVTSSTMPPDSADTQGVALADFSGDGLPELFLGGVLSGLRRYTNTRGSFAVAGMTALNLVARGTTVDLDGDGAEDVVFGRSGSNFGFALLNRAASSSPYALTNPGERLAILDADRDGDLDVAGFGSRVYPPVLASNLRRHLFVPAAHPPGGTFLLEFWSQGEPALAWPFVAPARLEPRPRLAGLGFLGLHPKALLPLPPVSLASGHGTATLRVPPDPRLAGVSPWLQALTPSGLTNVDGEPIR